MVTNKAYDKKFSFYVLNAVRKGTPYHEALRLAKKKTDRWARDQDKKELGKMIQQVMDLAPHVYGPNVERKEQTSDLWQFTSR